MLVQPGLGQGAFRVLVTDAHQHRCAVAGEYLHTLFDASYATVTPRLGLRVSCRIHDEFENGRDYALDRCVVRLPDAAQISAVPPPSVATIEYGPLGVAPRLALWGPNKETE